MKKILLFTLILIITGLLTFTGCYVVTEEGEDSTVYGKGWIGSWDVTAAIGNDDLNVENRTGETIVNIKRYIQTITPEIPDEPNWDDSGVIDILAGTIINGSSSAFEIQTSIGASAGDRVWVKIDNDGSKYITASFGYDNNQDWWLTINKEE
ncbi:MAG: hypothetical protein KAT05_10665 [Spirochaetes bacterium]|nr:hypothetical protein [Spirochaetota bacterium]